jgi:uncharacterized protein YhjY with autotransporter beta-barrel domain
MSVGDDARADGALEAIDFPESLALAHVAAAAGFERNGRAAAHTTAGCDERAFAPNGRRVDRSAETFRSPQFLASLWIERGDAAWKTDDQFFPLAALDEHRRAPRTAGSTTAHSATTTATKSTARSTGPTELRTRQRRVEALAQLRFIECTGFVAIPFAEPF